MPKTIVFIIPLPPPVHGSAMMCQQIRHNEFLNEHCHCHYINLSTSRQINEVGNNSPIKFLRLARILWQVMGHLIIRCADLYCIAPALLPGGLLKDGLVILLCKLFRGKVVLYLHGKGIQQHAQDSMWYHWWSRLIFRKTKVILLSEQLYEDIAEMVPRKDVLICPNGVEDLSSENERTAKNNDIKHLLFLSNLVLSKGVLDLLDACQLLRGKNRTFCCHFVGNESADMPFSRFEQEVRVRGLEGSVVCHGPQYGTEKIARLTEADLFVLPTYNDCFPLVLLEAMQFALPIVTTPEGAITDIVQDGKTGWIVPQHDAATLATQLAWCMDHPDLCKVAGLRGQERFFRNFTLKAFQTRLSGIFVELTQDEAGIFKA